MIYCGYQGVGKSTYCKNNPDTTVDLDSSNFKKVDNWYVDYVETAVRLSKDKDVFISAHKEVLAYLRRRDYYFELIVPEDSKELWAKRLEFRYYKNPTIANLKALHDFNLNFDRDMDLYNYYAEVCGIRIYRVTSKIVTTIENCIKNN